MLPVMVAIPWQVIGGTVAILGFSIAMVALGYRALSMSPPDFKHGRGWFWFSAVWTMAWSAILILGTSRAIWPILILVVIEVAVAAALIIGLRWIGSRERLHQESAPSMASAAEIELKEERNRLDQEHLKRDVEERTKALRERDEYKFFQELGRHIEESVNPRIHLHPEPRKPDAPEVPAPQHEPNEDK
jgi:hypothetical protein